MDWSAWLRALIGFSLFIAGMYALSHLLDLDDEELLADLADVDVADDDGTFPWSAA